jgi:large conductance mechanosensitive channel
MYGGDNMAKKIVDKEKLEKMKEKGHGFFAEFKEFVMRGNVMDMAIGVIIGTAFASIVTALTEDFINPLINGLGGAEVGGQLKIYGGQVIKYGDFITAVINFLIMALVLFVMLKAVNKVMSFGKKEKEEEATKSDELVVMEEIRDLLKKQK